ncbi:hypothetical protein NDU88_009724 [Pleurodeles waltl]|uniref:Uncharacterized protein n=1 Tax=Pleurodeles waltl TaxID=8319 RepID=A0AAV7S1U8_PLEWA|nr:hypothetical protein NDU88_009724 [Pleurodeles waltl]
MRFQHGPLTSPLPFHHQNLQVHRGDLRPVTVPPDSRGQPCQHRPRPAAVCHGRHLPPRRPCPTPRAHRTTARASKVTSPLHRLRQAPVSWVPLSAVWGSFRKVEGVSRPSVRSGSALGKRPTNTPSSAQRAPTILGARATGSPSFRAPYATGPAAPYESSSSSHLSHAPGAQGDGLDTAWMESDDRGVRTTLKPKG